MSLFSALMGEPQRRRPTSWRGASNFVAEEGVADTWAAPREYEDINWEPDSFEPRTCDTCRKVFLYGSMTYLASGKRCSACVLKYSGFERGRMIRPGKVRLTRGDLIESVRDGSYAPGPELAATLRAHGQEISACPACGRVRLRLVGQACGGTGCEKQRRFF